MGLNSLVPAQHRGDLRKERFVTLSPGALRGILVPPQRRTAGLLRQGQS